VTLAPKGLLIEESRTNLLLRSEEFENAAWLKGNASVTANTTAAPDGSTTADSLNEGTATAAHLIEVVQTLVPNANYAYSCFAKDIDGVYLVLAIRGAINNYASATFNLSTGTVDSSGAAGTGFAVSSTSIVDVGDGWYRCVLNLVVGTTVSSARNFVSMWDGVVSIGTSGVYSYTGTSRRIAIWGAQLEQAAFATSYIPSVASQVTRAADNASMIGNNFARWYRQQTGSIFTEASAVAPAQTAQVFGISDGSIPNRIVSSSTAVDSVFIAANGVVQASLNTSVVASNVMSKLASAFAINDVAVSRSGASVVTDTSALMPVVDRMFIGNGALGSGATLNGHIKRIAYYNRRLANTELTTLTS
jgi:hypothetical protein